MLKSGQKAYSYLWSSGLPTKEWDYGDVCIVYTDSIQSFFLNFLLTTFFKFDFCFAKLLSISLKAFFKDRNEINLMILIFTEFQLVLKHYRFWIPLYDKQCLKKHVETGTLERVD